MAAPVDPAHAQDGSELFNGGSTAFTAGDYLEALSLFEKARDVGSRGPAVHYNIAVCQFRLGNYAEAADTFRLIADDFPAMRALALYNIGLVRLRQDREAEARALFEQARRESTDETVTRLAEAVLRRTAPGQADPERSFWVSQLDAKLGFDDNVALVDEASLPATQSVDSPFTELFGFLSGPWNSPSGLRFDGSAYLVRYTDATQYNQTTLRLGGVYEWRATSWRIEAGPAFNYSTLDGEGFEQRLGIGLRMRRFLTSAMTLILAASHDAVDNVEPQFAYLAGSRQQLEVSVDRRGGAGRLSLGYELELNDRDDPNVSPTRNRVWLRYRYSPNPDWSADARISFRSSRYDDLATPRDEDLADISLGYQRRFSGGWEVTGSYRRSDNNSNVDLFSYARNRLSVGVTKNF
jgi:tetratricopeptide (TPR) repeat protein